MQDMLKIVVNSRSTNRLPFEEIILLKLHAVFKLLGKPIAPFADHHSHVLHDTFQVRIFLGCGDGDVSNPTADIYQCRALGGRDEGLIDRHEVEWGTTRGCHTLAETYAHGLVIGAGILKVALVC